MSEKTCTKCGQSKPLSEYYRDAKARDGHQFHCKQCDGASRRAYYQANKVKILEHNEKYAKENRDIILAYGKQYHAGHREENRQRCHEYYLANKERMNAQSSAYQQAHKEERSLYQKQYQVENKERLAMRAKERVTAYDEHVKERMNARSRQLYRELKNRILLFLGGKCYCCGLDDLRFLTIEHLKNNGKDDRRPNGKSRNSYMILRSIWAKIQVMDDPSAEYATACYNCNCSRQSSPGRICPHKQFS
jgi:hypothetical protein